MGYMRHHAIIVTDSGYGNFIEKAWSKAHEIFAWVSPISPGRINHIRSFFLAPDGSKEGWAESNIGDSERNEFITYLESLKYDDGSSPLRWCEIQYGDDNHENKILRTEYNKEA